MKKIIGLFLIIGAFILFNASLASASAPTLSLSNTGDGDSVQITVNGDINSNVLLFYTKTAGATQLTYLGTTNASGYLSLTKSTAELDVAPSSPVSVKINNINSASVNWPYNISTGTGAITLNNTGLILTVGNSSTLTVNNLGSNKLYLLNNTNPQIANINISGSQLTVNANAYGQTVMTVCALGTTSNCTSAYITVQNSGAQPLTLSQSNITIAYSQSATVSILNSTGNYTILNNSNPNVITASISEQTITLHASNNGGSAAITVCKTDMSACGIINASVGSVSSAALTFSQTAPTLTIGQTLTITLSGGTSYNLSSNANTSVVNAYVNNSVLTLVGNGAGSSVITVCANNGNCNSLTATVSYASSGGAITLSQSNLWLQIGQAVSVVISGGSTPYSFLADTGASTYFQSSLNNNILTLTGVKAGSGSLSVCSAGGACVPLSVLVNGVSSNTQLTFGNNNLNLTVGATSDVTLYGAGGYYITTSNNQNVATFTLNGDKIRVAALSAGNANVTVCQTGGQCGVIYAAVSATTAITPIAFSSSNPALSIGQSALISVSGGSGSAYYISSNSNPAIAQVNLDNNVVSVLGKTAGTTVVTICSASNNCNSFSVTVNSTTTTTTTTTPTTTTSTTASGGDILSVINNESIMLAGGSVEAIVGAVSGTRDMTLEGTYSVRYVNPLVGTKSLSAAALNTLNYFIVYGTPSTLKLGAGERAGVLGSYAAAYGKLPVTAAQWSDLLKIASGRWPSELSASAEAQAKIEFAKVYNRAANMSNNKDANAVTIIAYGLRPTSRNTKSEQTAILSFRYVYAHAPINSLAWNIVRAIAYSGAAR
ncbi:MAG: hypothetical protein WC467_02080 [Patescibacteria group bacterium]